MCISQKVLSEHVRYRVLVAIDYAVARSIFTEEVTQALRSRYRTLCIEQTSFHMSHENPPNILHLPANSFQRKISARIESNNVKGSLQGIDVVQQASCLQIDSQKHFHDITYIPTVIF